MISTKYFTETIKYLGIPFDVFRRTYNKIEHYAARKGGSAYLHVTGVKEFDEDWIKYGRE